MQLGEIYKHKLGDSKILISRFAVNGNREKDLMLIIADTFMDKEMLWSSPSFSLFFNSEKEILEDYELFMTQKEYENYIEGKSKEDNDD